MKKQKLFFLLAFLCSGIFSAYAYDLSFEKPVLNENYMSLNNVGYFDLTTTSPTYTQLIGISDGAKFKFRGIIDFGGYEGNEGAFTVTYSNSLVPTDSVSTNQPTGGFFDIYIDDTKLPIAHIPTCKSKIKVGAVLTSTQISSTVVIPATVGMPIGFHSVVIVWKGQNYSLFNVKIESNGGNLAIDPDRSVLNATTNLLEQAQPFKSDGNILIPCREMSITPKVGHGNLGLVNATDIGWFWETEWFTVGKVDFGATKDYVSVAIETQQKYRLNGALQIFLDSIPTAPGATPSITIPGIVGTNGAFATIEGFFAADSIPTGPHTVYITAKNSGCDVRSLSFRKPQPVFYGELSTAIEVANAVSIADVPASDGVTSGYSYPADAKATFAAAIASAQAMVDANAATQMQVNAMKVDLDKAVAAVKLSRIFTAVGDNFMVYPNDYAGLVAGVCVLEGGGNLGASKHGGVYKIGNVDFGVTPAYKSLFALSSNNGSPAGTATGALYKFYIDDYSVDSINVVSSPKIYFTENWGTYVETNDTLKAITGVHPLYIKFYQPLNPGGWVGNVKLIGLSYTALTPNAVNNVSGSINAFVYSADKTLYVKDATEGSVLEVYSLTGMKLKSKVLTGSTESVTLATGVYIVRVKSAEGIYTGKVVLK